MKKLLLLIAVIMCFGSLRATPGLTGSGTLADPYKIYTAADLDLVRNYLGMANIDKYFLLMNDIDLTTYLAPAGGGYTQTDWGTKGWMPIGSSIASFYGVFDGNYHKITGLKIDRATDAIGLFGRLGDGGGVGQHQSSVKNLGVDIDAAASVKGGGTGVGGLVGNEGASAVISNCYVIGAVINNGTITGGLVGLAAGGVEKCFSSGSVTGVDYVGGLIGNCGGNAPNAVVACYSTSTVSGTNGLGGLVGEGQGSGNTITNCFARGSVTSTTNSFRVGGLVGYAVNSIVNNCYSTGLVTSSYSNASYVGGLFGDTPTSPAANSFWDMTTSNKSTSPGSNATVVGKVTADMKTQTTFTNASWNFTTTWAMSASVNDGYPYLLNIPFSPLPVELTTFTASAEKNGITLSWKTATETNNYGFEIQRSAISTQQSDNVWLKIGFVEGNGTTNAPKSYSFTDKSANGKTSYRLKQIDRDGKFEYSQTVEVTAAIAPKEFSLEQNYPNPFNPTTSISYQLSANSFTTLKIYDAIGREVATLVNEAKDAGTYTAQFDGAKLSSGIYFAKLTSDRKTQMKKLLLLK